jgi:aminoacyl tRNA synthase complex-interacting multifunctional protein 1
MSESRANLVASVIYGSSIKPGTNPISVIRTASASCHSESQWLGANDEEKARISSWMEADLKDEKLLLADLEKVLAASSFVALPNRETGADLIVYSFLSSKKLDGSLVKTNPNVARWLNHMQTLVGKTSGNPEYFKFKISGLKAAQADSGSFTTAPPAQPQAGGDKPKQDSGKKEEHKEKKDKKKGDETAKAPTEGQPDATAAAVPENASPAKKEGKAKEAKPKEEKPKQEEEEEPKKKKPSMEKKEPLSEFLPLLLDVRVGKILSAKQLTDKLFIEEIDVGEPEPRVVCSGLVQFYSSADQIAGKMVLVVCNLKPRKMADSESNGMVLAASNTDKSMVKLVEVPEGSKPGDRVSYTDAPAPPTEIMPANQVNKKKILESVMPGWGTNGDGQVVYTDKEKNTTHTMLVNGKPCLGGDIKNGTVG